MPHLIINALCFAAGTIIGAFAGALAYRKNAKKIEAEVAEVKAEAARVKSALSAAKADLESLRK